MTPLFFVLKRQNCGKNESSIGIVMYFNSFLVSLKRECIKVTKIDA